MTDSSYFPSSFPPSEVDADALNFNTEGTTELTFMMDEDQELSDPEFMEEMKGFTDLLNKHTCYEMIPASGKIVVLDVSLDIKAAFRALIENRIKSAPLWDFNVGDYVGMITVTDFINILRHYYHTQKEGFSELMENEYQIRKWRAISDSNLSTNHLISIHPDDSIYDAAKTLVDFHIHRVPIIDKEENNSTLHILSHHRILIFLISNVNNQCREQLLSRSIEELGIGTFNNVVTVLKDTPLIVTLNMLAERGISAVPLVDETGIVDAIYSKSDAAALAKHPDIFSLLDDPVQKFIEEKKLYTCRKTDTLQRVVVELMLGCNVRRIICVDSTKRVNGIISQSDIIKFFLSHS